MVAADTLQSSMALLQTVPEGCQSSMYEHLTTMVLKLLEDKPESISLKHISDLIKRQAMDKVESDPLVPFTQEADSSSSRAALKLYGCGFPVPADPPAVLARLLWRLCTPGRGVMVPALCKRSVMGRPDQLGHFVQGL